MAPSQKPYREDELRTRHKHDVTLFHCVICGKEIERGDLYYGKNYREAHYQCINKEHET